MKLMDLAMIGGGLALVGLAGFNEFRWRARLKGRRASGRVLSASVGFADEVPIYYPVVEYEVDGDRKVFASRFGSSIPPKVGSVVTVVIAPAFGMPEVLTPVNRYIGTASTLLFGILLFAAVVV